MTGGILVDRTAEMEAVRGGLRRAAGGDGGLLLLRGEAGIGKTRLVEEAVSEARRLGFDAAVGASLAESTALYHPWAEALGTLGLEHLLRDEAPPRLLALYLLGGGGVPAAKAERPGLTADPEIFAAMSNAVADFLREGLAQIAGPAGGNLLRFSLGTRGICILRAGSFALVAVVEGRENELFLQDMAHLVDEVDGRFGGVLREWDGRAVEGLEPVLRAVLGSGKYEGIDLAADGQARKFNLFDNLLFGLHRRTALRPLLVVLDDLQWADPSSLGLLHYLARNTRRDRLLLMGAYRVDDAGLRPHLREALDGMAREGLCVEVSVGPLSTEDTRALAGALLGQNDMPDAFHDLLARETGGNPLFVREIIMALEQEGAIVAEAGVRRLAGPLSRVEVPGRVREVVVRRLGRLTHEERALLDAAAVCGTKFSGSLAAKVIGEPEVKVLRGLTAISRSLALVRAEGGSWRFNNPVVREVLYSDMAESLRRSFHRAAGDALVAAVSGGPAASDEIGEHFAAAGDPRAVVHLRNAAAAAMARGAPDEASRFLIRALELAPPQEKAALVDALTEAHEFAGRYEEALSSLAAAGAVDPHPARYARRRIDILERLGRWDEALRTADGALQREPADETAYLRDAKAFVLMRLGRHEEAEKEAASALGMFPPEEKNGRSNALNTIAACHYFRGRYDEALRCLTEGLRLREEAGNRRGVSSILTNIGNVYYQMGRLDAALDYHRRCLTLAGAIGYRYGMGTSLSNISAIYLDMGELDTAMEHARHALAIDETIGNRYGISSALAHIGGVLARRGDAAGALDHLDRAIGLCRALGNQVWLMHVLVETVHPLIDRRRAAAAMERAEEALHLARGAGLRLQEAQSLCAMGVAVMASGDTKAAAARFAEALETIATVGNPLVKAGILLEWGAAEMMYGSREGAGEHLGKAAELFEEMKLPKRAEEARRLIDGRP